jgi:hypothetical protein
LGLVAKSDGVDPTQNGVFAWHDGAGIWNLVKRIGGSFSLIGTASETWTTGTRTVSLAFDGQQVILRSGAPGSSTFDMVRITTQLTASDVNALDGFTYHGLFSRNGTGSQSGYDNFSVVYNPAEVIPMPVDFTPFVNMGMLALGLAFVLVGEFRREPMYLMVGSIIMIASALVIGWNLITVLIAVATLAIWYRAYAISEWIQNRNRDLE